MANINFIVKNDIELKGNLIFEGATDNEFETTLAITDPTSDRTITFPDNSGTVSLTSDSPLTQTSFRNILINGDFKIWQRGTSGTQSGGSVFVDMWRQYTDTGSGTQSRDTTVGVAGVTSQSYKFTVGGSATNFSLWQIIESANCAHLIGQTVTLSFYAQASAARSINATMALSTATDAVWTGTWTTFSTTAISVGTSMTRYTVTATVPANMRTMNVGFSNGGTNFPAGFTINITGVQLERGTIATPFEQRPIGTEISLCQRYFQKSFPITTTPASPGGTGAGSANNLVVFNQTLGNAYSSLIRFQTTMRRSPDITLYNSETSNTGTWSIYNSAGALNSSYAVSADPHHNGIMVQVPGVPSTTVANGAWTASAEL